MEIFLARHGQDEDNESGILNGRRDEPLTPLGESQAWEVSEKIKERKMHFDVVYSSPLQRALRTAQTISEISDNPTPFKMEELIERDFGVMTGIEVSRIKELCAPDIIETSTITYFLNPEGAETFPDLIVRSKRVLEKIGQEHAGKSVLLVSHGYIGKMIYAAFYNLPWKRVLTDFHFGNSELLHLSEHSDPSETHIFTIEQHSH